MMRVDYTAPIVPGLSDQPSVPAHVSEAWRPVGEAPRLPESITRWNTRMAVIHHERQELHALLLDVESRTHPTTAALWMRAVRMAEALAFDESAALASRVSESLAEHLPGFSPMVRAAVEHCSQTPPCPGCARPQEWW